MAEPRGLAYYRAHLQTAVEAAKERFEVAVTELVAAGREVEEHTNAAGELAVLDYDQPAPRRVLADLIEAAEKRRLAARAQLNAATATRKVAERALGELGEGHDA